MCTRIVLLKAYINCTLFSTTQTCYNLENWGEEKNNITIHHVETGPAYGEKEQVAPLCITSADFISPFSISASSYLQNNNLKLSHCKHL